MIIFILIVLGNYEIPPLLKDIWLDRLNDIVNEELTQPKQKVFKPKHAIPKLRTYEGRAPHWYWDLFPSNYQCPAEPKIDGDKLENLALQYGYNDIQHLKKVVNWIKNGADIGCKGEYREPTRARNTDSAIEEGYKISDAIADWVHKGYAYGPVHYKDVPKHAKFNGIMARAKPNGSTRIILNLSSPKGMKLYLFL